MKQFSILALFTLLFFSICNGQKNSNGWTNLFDSRTFNGWKKVAGNAEYSINNRVITGKTVPNTSNTFLVKEKEYGDFILELEVMIEDTTSNSGIQFRSHFDTAANNGKGRGRVYDYQYELDPSMRRWTGGLYDEGRRGWLHPLTLNPSGQNTLVQLIKHGWMIFHVVDTFDLNGFIALQVHCITKPEMAWRKIHWKNIRIKTSGLKPLPFPKEIYVENTIPNNLSASEKSTGWKLLFDGKTSNRWKGAYKSRFPEKGWEIKDGLLSVLSSEGKESTNGGDIVTKEKFGAFDLSFEFKLTLGANSGVKYFVILSENNQVLLLELNTNFWMIHCIQKLKWEEKETVHLLLYMI